MLKMVFEDGFVHADLHPGNIFITRDDRVAILDLGLVGELDGRTATGSPATSRPGRRATARRWRR